MTSRYSFIILTLLLTLVFDVLAKTSSDDQSQILSTLKFVVVPESNYQNDEYTLFTISSLNDRLSSIGVEYVEPTVLEKLRKKLAKVYEEKKGEVMTFSQLLASEAGGNVYIDVSTKVEDREMSSLTSSYQGAPSVRIRQVHIRITLSSYDVSTGRGLGKVIVSTNVPIAGNTSEKIEGVISKLSESGLNDVISRIIKYLEGGRLVLLKVIGVKSTDEREISTVIDGISSVKMKKRKSLSEGYVEYDVVIVGKTDDFVDELRDSLRTLPSIQKTDITHSQNLVILKVK
ncbi:MAG: hypothetical protein N3D81_04480 [Spirochaetes bacterium]|nr:hypothetical protein [Spirochaetota bacterium]